MNTLEMNDLNLSVRNLCKPQNLYLLKTKWKGGFFLSIDNHLRGL